jgi:hypothetical protein
MARTKTDFDAVRRIVRELSGVEESPMYGSPAFKVNGKLLTCIPVNKSAEPESLAVCIDPDRRAELMAAAPDIYYVTEHYENYPMVLVRLSRIHSDALHDLLNMAYRFVSAKSRGRKKSSPLQR